MLSLKSYFRRSHEADLRLERRHPATLTRFEKTSENGRWRWSVGWGLTLDLSLRLSFLPFLGDVCRWKGRSTGVLSCQKASNSVKSLNRCSTLCNTSRLEGFFWRLHYNSRHPHSLAVEWRRNQQAKLLCCNDSGKGLTDILVTGKSTFWETSFATIWTKFAR